MDKKIRIAVDAMGGDGSPKKIIDGISDHNKKSKNIHYLIFGDKEIILKHIPKTLQNHCYEIIDTKDRVEGKDTPLEAAKRGNSLILSLNKNINEENNRFKRINVKNVSSLSSMINKPIENIEIRIKDDNFLDKINKILYKNGKTNVKISITVDEKNYAFKLRNKRLVDRKHINLLKKQGINTNIF